MSVYGVTRLAWDLEHADGVLARYRRDPHVVLDGYVLTGPERAAVHDLDAPALLAAGVNPVAVRNLFVLLGVTHRDMFAADRQVDPGRRFAP